MLNHINDLKSSIGSAGRVSKIAISIWGLGGGGVTVGGSLHKLPVPTSRSIVKQSHAVGPESNAFVKRAGSKFSSRQNFYKSRSLSLRPS